MYVPTFVPAPPLFRTVGKSGDEATIDSVTITPDPPVKGQDVNVKATVTFSKECFCFLQNGNIKAYYLDLGRVAVENPAS